MTECIQNEFKFQGLDKRNVIAKFDGGSITSDAGALLLREVDKKAGILGLFSDCFSDYRKESETDHSVLELLKQRVYGIALGYEDLNDHDDLMRDPFMAVLCDKKDPTGAYRRNKQDKGKACAGKSTLNRLELTKDHKSAECDRYKKIAYDYEKMARTFVDVFLSSRKKEPTEIILDLDTTDDLIHGNQEGRYFHGYYGDYCYLPLYIFCGDDLLCAKLNTSDKGAGKDAVAEVSRIVSHIRERWKKTHIILRGDGDFSKDDLMSWCEDTEGVDYIFGLRKNARLLALIEDDLRLAEEYYEFTGEKHRIFSEFSYQTLTSWNTSRRVIAKAEHLERGSNPRFVVTSLTSEQKEDIQALYEKSYCARGDMENRIKEQQLDLFSDRTSTHNLRSNQLRLWFSSIAYLLLVALRRPLKKTKLQNAQVSTIRTKLLKIGAQIVVSVRRIVLSLASGYPYKDIFEKIYYRLRGPDIYAHV